MEVKTKELTKYFNYEMCKSCGGKCCTHHAGMYVPEDFEEEITVDFIPSLLNTGKIGIDWWEGDVKNLGKLSRSLYIRRRHVNESAIVGSWGGICVSWSKEKGCSLSEKERPFQCRMLIPSMEKGLYTCDTKEKATKKACTTKWYDYNEIIEQAINLYKE